MAFDGSGTYAVLTAPTFPAVAGQTIISTYYNAVINDIASALSLCITRDGQGKPSAAQNWNGQNLTNVGTFSAGSITSLGTLAGVTLTVSGNGTIAGTLGVTGVLTAGSLVLGTALLTAYGGTGLDAHLAANGQLLIGNGSGFTLATLTAGAGITLTNGAGTISIAASGGGASGTTSFPLTINNGGAGVASGGTFDGSAAKTISYNSIGAKPNTPQINSQASAATVTPTFSDDEVVITAQAANLTLANPTGTALQGWGIVIRIKDNGTARTISYGTKYRAIGVTLPTTTVISKTLYIGMIYNSTDTKWDVVSVAQEA